jgi:ectoine hydroxylase-related dioxygenase (phytanoyl-CoA dioxygenase family)
MGEGSIIWTYISSSIPPHYKNFSTRIHVDRPRLFADYIECLGSVIYLDDVFDENGSTWILPGSQNRADEPSEEEFYKSAIQISAPAGSVFYFNTRLWHAGGFNHTDQWRHALGIGVVRPYLKQKFDFPKIIRHEQDVSDYVKQKLGCFAIPPASLDEFWATDDKRSYREKSEWEMVKLGF